MDHIVYLDAKAKELENLQNRKKSMIIRGATGRKLPYGRVNEGDVLYFAENKGDGLLKAKAVVKSVYQSEKLSKEESEKIVAENQDKLQLNKPLLKRFAGKRYLVLLEVASFETLDPFAFDRSNYGNMDDWLPVENIKHVLK
ncbi:MAG TPA: hypothetical protein VJ919_06445 [Tangfeifania sp.]|nr:hypothetical protein [Tangfeifania sp.]